MGEKIPILWDSQVVKAQESMGFAYVSHRGSHRKYRNIDGRIVIVVMGDRIARGTLRSILLQAGVTLDEFLKHVK